MSRADMTTCAKKPYATLALAEKAITWAMKQLSYDGWKLRAYKCRACEWYHFGHIDARVKREQVK